MNTPVRRVLGGLVATLLAAGSAACTSSSDTPRSAPSSPGSTGSSATLDARPVPLKVMVTRVSGRLPAKDRRALEHNVGAAVSTYVDGAFLGGTYPRSDFTDAFGSFSAGARRAALKDRNLVTNALLGPTTKSVATKEQSAYLSVLAPYKVAAGVTARLTVRFVADRGDAPAKQVTVSGRLMLTRQASGGWKIFGYDLSRSVRTVGEGS